VLLTVEADEEVSLTETERIRLIYNDFVMTLTWYRHFERNGGLNQILRRQTSRSHYGSKVPAVTVTVFKYRNKIVFLLLLHIGSSSKGKKPS
jgi:hypothetical protein